MTFLMQGLLHELWRNGVSQKSETLLRPGSLLRLARGAFLVVRNPTLSREWIEFLDGFARRYHLPPALPDLVTKPLDSYAIYDVNFRDRITMLREHYALAAEVMPRSLFIALWIGKMVCVGDLVGKSGRIYQLRLNLAGHHSKEGEHSMVLVDTADGLTLATLTFLLIPGCETKLDVLIGGLQGPSTHFDADRKRRVISATRDLSGLRPNFTAVSAFAAGVDAHNLHAVSRTSHTINADARFQRERMHADYDAFWIERSGVGGAFGFKLPVDTSSKSRRAGYRKQKAHVVKLVGALFEGIGFSNPLGCFASVDAR